MTLRKDVFYYKATIMRDGVQGIREGTVLSRSYLEALDQVTGMAINEWRRPLLKIEIHEVDKDGELVAVSTLSERLDAVLKTKKALEPDRYKHIHEAREKRKALPPPPKKESKAPTRTYDRTYTWAHEVGTTVQKPNFATLKLQKGAFQ